MRPSHAQKLFYMTVLQKWLLCVEMFWGFNFLVTSIWKGTKFNVLLVKGTVYRGVKGIHARNKMITSASSDIGHNHLKNNRTS